MPKNDKYEMTWREGVKFGVGLTLIWASASGLVTEHPDAGSWLDVCLFVWFAFGAFIVIIGLKK